MKNPWLPVPPENFDLSKEIKYEKIRRNNVFFEVGQEVVSLTNEQRFNVVRKSQKALGDNSKRRRDAS